MGLIAMAYGSEGNEAASEATDAPGADWAGSTEPGRAHYYRIQGPTLFLEYVNVVRDRGRTHAVLRDPGGDFGVRLLD